MVTASVSSHRSLAIVLWQSLYLQQVQAFCGIRLDAPIEELAWNPVESSGIQIAIEFRGTLD